MPDAPLRVGTRASALALWQTEHVRALIAARGLATERIEIRTTGDVVQDVPLARIGSRALFTRQIDDAMLEGRIDLAVHSLKDLSTTLPDGLVLAAVGEREDPRDALVGRAPLRWTDLPDSAIVATSSLRRRAQLLRLRPDLRVEDVRGNVDTRLAKLDAHPEWTAIMLATAGLVRLGLGPRIGERLSPALMLPAPGQGALAVTARADDSRAISAAGRAVHHADTGLATAAERAFLRRLEGGCQVPIAAYATIEREGRGATLRLHGRVVSLQGEDSLEDGDAAELSDIMGAERLGTILADRLLARGAGALLNAVRATVGPLVPEP